MELAITIEQLILHINLNSAISRVIASNEKG